MKPETFRAHEAAYHAGAVAAAAMMEAFQYAHKVFGAYDELREPGDPRQDWQYLRGFLDALEPVFVRTINTAEQLALSRFLTRRMKNAPRIVRDTLRRAVLDDLYDSLDAGLQAAQEPRGFDPGLGEW
ncbi:MAG: hypothetical protein LBQ81_11730 [Zoogloeaceae bacterium]|jgi:hypothetical protein|nr:hypothetical protein [Zoogloeaceae bacterium]